MRVLLLLVDSFNRLNFSRVMLYISLFFGVVSAVSVNDGLGSAGL